MFKAAKTEWVWTELTESLHPDRKAGEPVYDHYRKTVHRSWVEKGYVVDASEIEGQHALKFE